MSPEFREFIQRSDFYQGAVREVAGMLPVEDAALDGLIAEAVAASDENEFVFIVMAAFHAGRPVSASHLARGTLRIPDKYFLGVIASHMAGDISGPLLEAVTNLRLSTELVSSALFLATQWQQQHLGAKLSAKLIAAARTAARNKGNTPYDQTLLLAVAYPSEQLIALYARRWHLELALRHLKTTMGMELLRCQSPDMAEKELMAYLVAYNLVRCLMAQALALAGAELARLSFRGTVDALRQYNLAAQNRRGRSHSCQLWKELIKTIARDLLPLRPGRQEPRAVKRRPKAYQLLNKPRHVFKEVPHRCRYRANNTLKNRALI